MLFLIVLYEPAPAPARAIVVLSSNLNATGGFGGTSPLVLLKAPAKANDWIEILEASDVTLIGPLPDAVDMNVALLRLSFVA